jgi:hypothetical protein
LQLWNRPFVIRVVLGQMIQLVVHLAAIVNQHPVGVGLLVEAVAQVAGGTLAVDVT